MITVIILTFSNENFLTTNNLYNQGRLLAEIGLMALPMTFIIITGGIDLSVGSIAGLSAIALGYSWFNLGYPLEVAILIALAVVGAFGLMLLVLYSVILIPLSPINPRRNPVAVRCQSIPKWS